MLSFKHFLALSETDASLLVEGGNIWKGDLATQRIKQADVAPTVKWLEQVTGLPLVDNMIGSTGKTPTSGDIDVVVDAEKVNKDDLAAKLLAWAKAKDPNALVKKGGVNVHFRTPVKGDARNGYVQTDFMFLPDLEFVKWSTTPTTVSKFKAVHRTIVMASIARSLGLRWSYMHGLSTRTSDKLLRGGKDPEYIADVLLGPAASANDLETVESILAKLQNDPKRGEKLADAKETLGKEGIDLRSMIDI